ncbi:peptidoglycan recognition family protein [Brevibacillus laterosporus]|uniref:peptidoglycan recognition protein family protein n=1 Tax=Brevibacillus laterosporus TaxID=1465 RepID=UPI00036870DC|nr:peptidoglycan recognition family protein [Brevibacillus laterosporus]ATO51392.1 hypothetical protein BrL25_21195 [Brevibacillus laterosporus DSM 25]MED2002729.1 peptidoglycan recognition family protein [Brevibacillus laterosporus]
MFVMKYPIQTKYVTPRTKRRSGIPMKRIGFIVAHDTGNPGSTALANIRYYQNTCDSTNASAHTFIDDTGVWECIPATTGKPEKAWHVLYEIPRNNQLFNGDANDIAIGVELCYLYHLQPEKHIVAHCDLDPNRKLDPTKNAFKRMNITWNQFIQDVIKEYKLCTPKSNIISSVVTKPAEGNEEDLKLNEWQFDMLTQALVDLTRNGYLTDKTWEEKAKSRTLIQSELSFITTMVLQRNLTGETK